MFKFLELEPESFGLNICDSSIKIVRLKKSGRFFKLASWGETVVENGIIKNGEILDQEELAKTIKKATSHLQGEKLNLSNVVSSLPDSKAFLQIIKMPKMSLEELYQSIKLEAENYIPLPAEKCFIDFQVIQSQDSSPDVLNVLVAAVPKDVANSYFFCLSRAGLNPQTFEIESQAICRSLIKNEFSPNPLLIIDFRQNSANFLIFCGYSLQLVSSAEFSIGSPENIFSEIKKYLNYYKEHEKKDINKIIVCGNGVDFKSFLKTLSQGVRPNIELGDPWINVLPPNLNELPGLNFQKSIGFASTIGLALRGARKKYD